MNISTIIAANRPEEPSFNGHPLTGTTALYSTGATALRSNDAISTMSASSATYIPSKPVLAPPTSGLAEFAVLKSLENLNTVGAGLLELNMNCLQDEHDKLKEIQAQNIKKVTESAQRMQAEKVWTHLKKIGVAVLAAVSTVLGMSLISSGAGTLIGGALIASGIVTLANLAFSETGVWNWVAEKLARDNQEKQKQLAVLLPAVIGTLAALVGMAGSAGAIGWTALNLGQKALLIVQTAVNFAEGVISIGEGAAKYRNLQTQADLTAIKHQLFENHNALEKITSGIEKFMRAQNSVLEQAKKVIRMAIQTNHLVALQA